MSFKWFSIIEFSGVTAMEHVELEGLLLKAKKLLFNIFLFIMRSVLSLKLVHFFSEN